MDILKRGLAPLTKEAWHEIDERATDVLKTHLSARKAVKVNGPKGLEHTVVPEGRLTMLDEDENDVRSGIYQVKPLIETRINFELDRWELDNIERGAKDIRLDALEQAAYKAAMFEENAIYNGYAKGVIDGLDPAAETIIPLGEDGVSIMDAISKGAIKLREAFAHPPLTLVAGEQAWHRINRETSSYPLSRRVEKLIGGDILYSPAVDGALLVPYDHEDLELTLGLDFSIGYESHDNKSVKLFIAESFTFRVLDPALIVKLTV